jgi:hypothetical protein
MLKPCYIDDGYLDANADQPITSQFNCIERRFPPACHAPSSYTPHGPPVYLFPADLKSSCCCARSSSCDRPLCSSLVLRFSRCYTTVRDYSPTIFFALTRSCSLCSPATESTSCTYSGNPSSRNALSMCSVAIVFFASRSAISFASEDMRVTNSTLQSIKRSRASLPKVNPALSPMISVMIFCIVARRL